MDVRVTFLLHLVSPVKKPCLVKLSHGLEIPPIPPSLRLPSPAATPSSIVSTLTLLPPPRPTLLPAASCQRTQAHHRSTTPLHTPPDPMMTNSANTSPVCALHAPNAPALSAAASPLWTKNGTGLPELSHKVSPGASTSSSSARCGIHDQVEMPIFDLLRTTAAGSSPFPACQALDELPRQLASHVDGTEPAPQCMDGLPFWPASPRQAPHDLLNLVEVVSVVDLVQVRQNLPKFHALALPDGAFSRGTVGPNMETYIPSSHKGLGYPMGTTIASILRPSTSLVSQSAAAWFQPTQPEIQGNTFRNADSSGDPEGSGWKKELLGFVHVDFHYLCLTMVCPF